MRDASPLRYPGGKWRFTDFVTRLINLNKLSQCSYVEPYAGGASLGLSLLFQNIVAEIHLNDLDPAIHAFWYSVLNHNRDFLDLLKSARITPDEWNKQKMIYSQGSSSGMFALGFATFFLNRTNHSGILNGGMIGGKEQRGAWRMDARFNLAELQRRIARVGDFRDRIYLYGEDAVVFLKSRRWTKRTLKYLDPPYYGAGSRLYMNSYCSRDHTDVSKYITGLESPWIVSYDDVAHIRELYFQVRSRKVNLLHTARSARIGKEILFFSEALRIPHMRRSACRGPK
jgi:DNA adenine methylase